MFDELLNEIFNKHILTEGRKETIDKKALQKVIENSRFSASDLQKTAKGDDNQPLLTMNGATQTYGQYIIRNIKEQYILPICSINQDAYRFEIGTARILFADLNYMQEAETDKNTRFKSVLKIITTQHYNEYTDNLERIENGKVVQPPCDLEELFDRFLGEVKQQESDERDMVNNTQYDQNVNQYKIVHIPNFETATKYRDYTSPRSPWCITCKLNYWKNYDEAGSKKIYFALQKGFENIPCVKGDNFPYDEYGLSMLCIQIDEFGNMTQCTSRWNHETSKGDQYLDAMGVSKVLGKSVFSVCKPYTNEELAEKGLQPLTEIKPLIESVIGKKVYKIRRTECPSVVEVYIHEDHTYEANWFNIPQKELFLDEWQLTDKDCQSIDGIIYYFQKCPNYPSVSLISYEDGPEHIDTYNCIDNKTGKVFFDEWVHYLSPFDPKGVALYRTFNNLFSFIDINGNKYDKMFNDCYDTRGWFPDDIVIARQYDNYFLIDKDYHIINTEEIYGIEILSRYNRLFDAMIYNQTENNTDFLIGVQYDKGWCMLNREGHAVCNYYFDAVGDMTNSHKLYSVMYNDKWDFVKMDGSLLYDEPVFDVVKDFYHGYAIVEKNGMKNCIDELGRLVCKDMWFDEIYYEEDHIDNSKEIFFIVKKNKRKNIMNVKGRRLSKLWIDQTSAIYYKPDKHLFMFNIDFDSYACDFNSNTYRYDYKNRQWQKI